MQQYPTNDLLPEQTPIEKITKLLAQCGFNDHEIKVELESVEKTDAMTPTGLKRLQKAVKAAQKKRSPRPATTYRGARRNAQR